MDQIQITDNKASRRFETKVDGDFAYLDYRFYKKDIALMHTFVPEASRGRGIAPALVQFAIDYAIENNMLIMIYCPFAAKYLKAHPEFDYLVDKSYK